MPAILEPIKTDRKSAFNFDLDRMKKAVEGPINMFPKNLTAEELLEWMKQKSKQG